MPQGSMAAQAGMIGMRGAKTGPDDFLKFR
jgi:hypothetical protein